MRAAAVSEPTTIHGRRRPNREYVRSENAPDSGLKTMAATAPRPLTQASAASLPSPPVIASAYLGSRLFSGVMSTMRMPMLARVMDARNTQLTSLVGSFSASTSGACAGRFTRADYACANPRSLMRGTTLSIVAIVGRTAWI